LSIRAVTFDKQKVKSQDDGLCHTLAMVNKSCVISGCAVAQDGASAVSIDVGVFFVCGRLVYITSPESIGIPSVPAGQTQYMRVVFEVNLNQTNTETEFMQGIFKVLSDSSAYPSLTQDDVNTGGTLHQMPFIKLRADSAGIISGSFTDERVQIYSVASLKQDIDGKAALGHTHTSLAALEITGNAGTDDLQVVNVYIYSGTTPSVSGKPNGTLFVKYVP
jgi:hypothetical protein